MTSLLVLDIPEDAAELASWLERQLVGLHLGQLAAELEIVHRGTPRTPATLDGLFAGQLPAILAHGLSRATPKQLRQLLQNPAALLALQERILMQGGDHWFSLQVAGDHWQAVNAGLEALDTTEFNPPKTRPRHDSGVSLRGYLSALVALTLLAGLGLWIFQQNQPAQPTGWGWNNTTAFQAGLPADEYLRKLGESAEAWKNKRPDNREDLAKRIGEFRTGCQRLINAPHEPLQPADKTWLIDKCKAWDAKLAQAETDLNAGADVLEIRGQVDVIQENLTKALRARADELAPAKDIS